MDEPIADCHCQHVTGGRCKFARDRDLEAALFDVYDSLPGPVFLLLSDETNAILTKLAKGRNPHAGKGRVTNRRLDMRLKANRGGPTDG